MLAKTSLTDVNQNSLGNNDKKISLVNVDKNSHDPRQSKNSPANVN